MGVEHYLVCYQCKQYIDLHKCYAFSMVIEKDRPPIGVDAEETEFNDVVLNGGYWEARGLWFLWAHRGHTEINMWTDCIDEWFFLKPKLEEKYPYVEDLKIRERMSKNK